MIHLNAFELSINLNIFLYRQSCRDTDLRRRLSPTAADRYWSTVRNLREQSRISKSREPHYSTYSYMQMVYHATCCTVVHLPLGQFWCAGLVPTVCGPAVPLALGAACADAGRSILYSFILFSCPSGFQVYLGSSGIVMKPVWRIWATWSGGWQCRRPLAARATASIWRRAGLSSCSNRSR